MIDSFRIVGRRDPTQYLCYLCEQDRYALVAAVVLTACSTRCVEHAVSSVLSTRHLQPANSVLQNTRV